MFMITQIVTALGVGGATTTYDWAGNRVSQTCSGAKYATTTDYVFNGDSLRLGPNSQPIISSSSKAGFTPKNGRV